jgi:hypothetical protein
MITDVMGVPVAQGRKALWLVTQKAIFKASR